MARKRGPHPRARCPYCERSITIRIDGRLHVHDDPDTSPRDARCPGSDTVPNAKGHTMSLDHQRTINALREKEGALAHALLDMRTEADRLAPGNVHVVHIPVTTAALALATLMRLCDSMNPSDPAPWILYRVAAADLSAVLVDRGRDDTAVWLDSRSADEAHAALCYVIDHNLADDVDVVKLAATDLANALNTLGEAAP